ncbi:hypothetical protein AAG906_007980 [Vitis piasezkii]
MERRMFLTTSAIVWRIPLHRHDYLYSTVRVPKGAQAVKLCSVVVNLNQDPLSDRKRGWLGAWSGSSQNNHKFLANNAIESLTMLNAIDTIASLDIVT